MFKWLGLVFCCTDVLAASVTIDIISKQHNPVFQAVVYLEPEAPSKTDVSSAPISVMDQIDRQFVPHILAIQKGTKVVFPNSDSIKHHVYSFSPAKSFELQLYKDSPAQTIAFAVNGEVELGCNVHDWMLAYIWVVDTPYFAKTDQLGRVTLDVPVGKYTLKVWHPRIKAEQDTLNQYIEVLDSTSISIQLQHDLFSDLSLYEQTNEGFTDYQ
ncbi:methylamine utilization protein [Aliiglaciecola sp. LCG003]|uniref:methylamine utilization protein n=1 Tax=Aliiglaciecola sp. LCG003 TaxID=3053655 RepID=UPI0025743E81|nr:methylamine utilization protein [Aliiglaciecola sp. LCG003]WJG10219.1 methylamine utilization protein [Aliiglaciecola sp. LCG003]